MTVTLLSNYQAGNLIRLNKKRKTTHSQKFMKQKLSGWISTKNFLSPALLAMMCGSAVAQTLIFSPGQLAVLRFGDGGTNRCLPLNGGSVAIPYTNYAASDIIGARQTAMYVDQYDPNGVNQTNP